MTTSLSVAASALLFATGDPPITVVVELDFGSSGRPPLERQVELPRGSTPVDAARALAPVEQDWLCCSGEDVWSISGVACTEK